MRVCRSPWLIAAYHGLHRLRVPRHPPHAFVCLTTYSSKTSRARAIFTSDNLAKVSQFDSLSHDLPLLPLSNSDAKCRAPRGTIWQSRWEWMSRRATRERLSVLTDLLASSVKEVIQPQVPLRLPCYDFAPVTALAFGRLAPCGFRHGLRALTASMA